jgi:gamma-glutamylaminecyclotransferase
MEGLEKDFTKCRFVAVYGTLKRDFWNHYFLEGCKFVGKGITLGRYKLFDVGFPYAVPDKNGLPLLVEVYELDTPKRLARLDYLEGYPDHYNRKIERVELEDGRVVEAWLYYTYNPDGEPYTETTFWKNKEVLDWK